MRARLLNLFGLVMIMAFGSAAACSSSPDISGPLPDGRTLIQDAVEASKLIKSAHFSLSVYGNVAGLGTQNAYGELARADNSPGAGIGYAEVIQSDQRVMAEFTLINGIIYVKDSNGQFVSHGDAANVYDFSVILSPNQGISKVISAVELPKVEGRETVNDVQAYRVGGKVPPDAIHDLLPGSTSAAEVKLWLRTEGSHLPVKLWIQLPPDKPGAGANAVTFNLSDVDKPVSVTAPNVNEPATVGTNPATAAR